MHKNSDVLALGRSAAFALVLLASMIFISGIIMSAWYDIKIEQVFYSIATGILASGSVVCLQIIFSRNGSA